MRSESTSKMSLALNAIEFLSKSNINITDDVSPLIYLTDVADACLSILTVAADAPKLLGDLQHHLLRLNLELMIKKITDPTSDELCSFLSLFSQENILNLKNFFLLRQDPLNHGETLLKASENLNDELLALSITDDKIIYDINQAILASLEKKYKSDHQKMKKALKKLNNQAIGDFLSLYSVKDKIINIRSKKPREKHIDVGRPQKENVNTGFMLHFKENDEKTLENIRQVIEKFDLKSMKVCYLDLSIQTLPFFKLLNRHLKNGHSDHILQMIAVNFPVIDDKNLQKHYEYYKELIIYLYKNNIQILPVAPRILLEPTSLLNQSTITDYTQKEIARNILSMTDELGENDTFIYLSNLLPLNAHTLLQIDEKNTINIDQLMPQEEIIHSQNQELEQNRLALIDKNPLVSISSYVLYIESLVLSLKLVETPLSQKMSGHDLHSTSFNNIFKLYMDIISPHEEPEHENIEEVKVKKNTGLLSLEQALHIYRMMNALNEEQAKDFLFLLNRKDSLLKNYGAKDSEPEKALKKLIKQAIKIVSELKVNEEIEEHQHHPYYTPLYKLLNLSHEALSLEKLSNALKKQDGILFFHMHNDLESYECLIQELGMMHKHGVKHLYLEFPPLLNDLVQKGNKEELIETFSQFKFTSFRTIELFIQLILAARRLEIKIFCIDETSNERGESLSQSNPNKKTWEFIVEMSNRKMADKIMEHNKSLLHGEKYIALIGLGHAPIQMHINQKSSLLMQKESNSPFFKKATDVVISWVFIPEDFLKTHNLKEIKNINQQPITGKDIVLFLNENESMVEGFSSVLPYFNNVTVTWKCDLNKVKQEMEHFYKK